MTDPESNTGAVAETAQSPGEEPGKKPWTDRRELKVRAPREHMWRAWADPEIIAGWFPDRARGEAVPGREIVHVFEAFGMEVVHRVLEADPPRRLVLEGTSPIGTDFHQEVRIEHHGGETVLELVHSGFSDEADWSEEYEGVESGWQLALAILRHYLENHFERSRSSIFLARPAPFEWDALQGLFRTREGLAAWLTSEGAIPPAGNEAELTFQDGDTLSGRVLADSGREVAVEWRELEGVLQLKAFGGGSSPQMLCLWAMSWADDESLLEARRPMLESALGRLAERCAAPASS